MGSAGTTLVTGGDGYVGSRVAATLVGRGDDVVLVVRDPDARREVTGRLVAAGARMFRADLRDPRAFATLDTSNVTRIVHAGAVTRFNVDMATAYDVNIEGTRSVLELARRCPALESLALISTAYASGLRAGRIEESLGDDLAGFANNYEWSKGSAERAAAHDYADLPVKVVRLATVIADDESGAVSQRNAFHTTLRLVYYGLLSVLPGDPSTPVHLVSGRYATQAIVALLDDVAARGTFHVTSGAAGALRLGDLLDLAWRRFEIEPDFRRRNPLRPLFVDIESFDDLASATETLGTSVVAQAMATMAPFARQLYVSKELSTVRTDSALARAAAPVRRDDLPTLARAAVDHVVSTRWGRSDGRAA